MKKVLYQRNQLMACRGAAKRDDLLVVDGRQDEEVGAEVHNGSQGPERIDAERIGPTPWFKVWIWTCPLWPPAVTPTLHVLRQRPSVLFPNPNSGWLSWSTSDRRALPCLASPCGLSPRSPNRSCSRRCSVLSCHWPRCSKMAAPNLQLHLLDSGSCRGSTACSSSRNADACERPLGSVGPFPWSPWPAEPLPQQRRASPGPLPRRCPLRSRRARRSSPSRRCHPC